MFGQTAESRARKTLCNVSLGLLLLTLHSSGSRVQTFLVQTCTVSAFFRSFFFFTCQSDFDAGPVPPSPRIRHHSGRNDHTQTSRWTLPKNTVSPLQREPERLEFENMRFVVVLLTGKNVLFHRKVLRSFEIQQHERTFSGRLKHVLTSCP